MRINVTKTYFCRMKKSTIWFIAVLMGGSFIALLYLQFRYFNEVVEMRKDQFSESVHRSLYITSRILELRETNEMLRERLGVEDRKVENTTLPDTALALTDVNFDSIDTYHISSFLFDSYNKNRKYDEQLREKVLESFLHHKGIVDEEIYSILYEPTGRPLKERIKPLEGELNRAFSNNGIGGNISWHYYVLDAKGDTVDVCKDYNPEGEEYTFTHVLFPDDPATQRGVLYVHFPGMKRFVYSGIKFIVPAILFTFLLLCMFIFTIYSFFRQKRLSEMKNDFINNMTHEFKTPISSISLASQMLCDTSIKKSDEMYKHLSTIITDETKRLRFQVEKVLQMSMFDEKGGTFQLDEISLNKLLEDVATTFRLNVESNGGKIITHLNAQNDTIYGDKMHLTNVAFNLLDNAIKYKHPNRALEIEIETKCHGDKITLKIKDNGIGIKRDDLRKVFEKFYRAHTGNRHDVKGFGLGLAYVRKVVNYHRGNIHAESNNGNGTTFVISLPLLK